jgi:hypothetical protein
LRSVAILKDRPWASVRCAHFAEGVAYFKASLPSGRHEAPLLRWLARRWPDAVPEVIAENAVNGWFLMADAGTPLRESSGTAALDALSRIVSRIAQMQITLSTVDVEDLLRLGVPDRRMHRLPALLAELIEDDVLCVGARAARTDALRARLRAALPDFALRCETLAASPHPASLDHGDLHLGNVLLRDGAARICDWGDACITHPFCSLAIVLEMGLAGRTGGERESCALALREVYLGLWARNSARARREQELDIALEIAPVLRALDFAWMCRDGDEASREAWLPAVAQQLERWLELRDANERLER